MPRKMIGSEGGGVRASSSAADCNAVSAVQFSVCLWKFSISPLVFFSFLFNGGDALSNGPCVAITCWRSLRTYTLLKATVRTKRTVTKSIIPKTTATDMTTVVILDERRASERLGDSVRGKQTTRYYYTNIVEDLSANTIAGGFLS